MPTGDVLSGDSRVFDSCWDARAIDYAGDGNCAPASLTLPTIPIVTVVVCAEQRIVVCMRECYLIPRDKWAMVGFRRLAMLCDDIG